MTAAGCTAIMAGAWLDTRLRDIAAYDARHDMLDSPMLTDFEILHIFT